MASVNNIFLVNEHPPVARYVKTILSKVGGIRFDSRGQNEVGFVLESDPTHFDYDSEVLEIYSERENRALKQLNRKLFSEGYLKEYNLEAPEVDTTNMLSDEAVVEIASLRNINSLKSRITELNSPFTIQRILTAATDIGRPQKTITVIEDRLKELK